MENSCEYSHSLSVADRRQCRGSVVKLRNFKRGSMGFHGIFCFVLLTISREDGRFYLRGSETWQSDVTSALHKLPSEAKFSHHATTEPPVLQRCSNNRCRIIKFMKCYSTRRMILLQYFLWITFYAVSLCQPRPGPKQRIKETFVVCRAQFNGTRRRWGRWVHEWQVLKPS